jgi:hypothetical protein
MGSTYTSDHGEFPAYNTYNGKYSTQTYTSVIVNIQHIRHTAISPVYASDNEKCPTYISDTEKCPTYISYSGKCLKYT